MSIEWKVDTKPICFAERLAASEGFKGLFKDGMNLVEETAAYLDGEGREEAKRLPRTAALSYASESMRLTTRLMQIASWLLLQRAVNEGEMSQAEAQSDKRRSRLAWQQGPKEFDERQGLPSRLVELIDSSFRLQERIARLDGLVSGETPASAPVLAHRPIELQMLRIREAFSG